MDLGRLTLFLYLKISFQILFVFVSVPGIVTLTLGISRLCLD